MCTAISFKTNEHYFGRTLDVDSDYNPQIIVMPRKYALRFNDLSLEKSHYAIIGAGIIKNDYPLYFDAVNECGLAAAGLNFPQNTHYNNFLKEKSNITSFEFINWILSKFKSVADFCDNSQNINITDEQFNFDMPVTPLHWIVSDKTENVTVESVKEGLRIYKNEVGVLTNNPPFDMQMWNLNNYLNLTNVYPENRFSLKLNLKPYSYGIGAVGLPGDLSSASRFVRAVFTKYNSECEEDELSSISQFFHILGAVEQQRGCAVTENGRFETTYYMSCCNTDRGVYYYKTYDSHSVYAVDIRRTDFISEKLMVFDMNKEMRINYLN